MSKIVRCTIEMDMIYGKHFFPDNDDDEVIQDSATEAFVTLLHEAIERDGCK